MKHIFLMRHGDAPNLPDDRSRRVSALGRVEAALMGAFLEERLAEDGIGAIGHVAVSDAPRTTETLLAMRLATAPIELTVVPALYTTSPEPAIAHLRRLEETVEAALVISHHPSVDRVVEILTAHRPATEAATGCLACLSFNGSWSTLGPATAHTRWRVAPSEVLDTMRSG